MGFLDRLMGRESRSVPVAAVKSSDPYLTEFFGLGRGGSGPIASPAEAVATLGVAGRCVSLIAEGLAALPCRIYRKNADGGRDLERTHPLDSLLNTVANDEATAFTIREGLVRDVAMYGNGFLHKVIDGRGRVAELRYLPWGTVGIERLFNSRLRYRVSGIAGTGYVLNADETVHLKYATRDGIIGISPLQWSGTAIGLAVAQAILAQNQVDRGFVSDMAFEMDAAFASGEAGETAFKRLKGQLRQAVSRMGATGDALVLEAGLKAKPLATSGRESQFHEARIRGMQDVATIFGVPHSVVGLATHSSYGSLTEESSALVRDCFRPWAARIDQELTRSLLTPEGRRHFEIAHDLDSLLAGDMETRFKVYEAGVRSTILSPNDARRMEGWNSRPGGDVYGNPNTSGPTPPASDPPALQGSSAVAQPAEA